MAPIFKFSNFAPKFKFVNFAPKFKFLNFAPDKWRQFSNFAPKFIFKFRAKITIFELRAIFQIFRPPKPKNGAEFKNSTALSDVRKTDKTVKTRKRFSVFRKPRKQKNNVVHGCHDLFSSLPRIVVCVSPRCAFVSFSFGWHVPHEC